MSDEKRIETGTKVIVCANLVNDNKHSPVALPYRRHVRVAGEVVESMSGLYGVRHADDGVIGCYTPDEIIHVADETVEQKAERLIAVGYLSTSHKFRLVGCVPPGKTALEALKEVSPRAYLDLMQRAEDWARTDLLRCHSVGQLELTEAEFRAFKKAGGQTV